MFEVQVNSPRSLKLPVLPSRAGREEVDNEEEPGDSVGGDEQRG